MPLLERKEEDDRSEDNIDCSYDPELYVDLLVYELPPRAYYGLVVPFSVDIPHDYSLVDVK